jgi:hypothetical protein
VRHDDLQHDADDRVAAGGCWESRRREPARLLPAYTAPRGRVRGQLRGRPGKQAQACSVGSPSHLLNYIAKFHVNNPGARFTKAFRRKNSSYNGMKRIVEKSS